MLATLKVRDLVLIEDIELDFAAGLNVLTGETGAGKSILLEALGLAAGARAGGRSNVRPGAEQGSAIAIFELPKNHAAQALISENGIVVDGEIILRRTISMDGRTRGFVNDETVGVRLLGDIGVLLVEIHGQADDRGLFDVATHRKLLDAFGGHEVLAAEVTAQFEKLARARDQMETLRRSAESAAADIDYVRHTVDELSALAPEPGEEERLASERVLLMNASRVGEDVSAALDLIAGDGGAESGLSAALKRLARMRPEAREPANSAHLALEQSLGLIEEARRELEAILSRLNVDSDEADKKEERLFALRAMARKYAVTVDDLPLILVDAKSKLDDISSEEGGLKAAEGEVARARQAFLERAAVLSDSRVRSARQLELAVTSELAPLKLGHARFRVAIEPLSNDDAAANGLERVAFEVATIEGAPFSQLARIASGGELARFSLALKVALSAASTPAALVFDEVDRGVGGAVADAVGERLQRLARTTQVLLVTHAPQVAARAERHFRITRRQDRTLVELLSAEERLEEIARMLSGAATTEEARAAARRLLLEAATAPKKMRKRA